MDYREYAPWPCLRSVVHCLWTLEGSATELGDEIQPVLPDGRPELIVHFGDAFERLHSDGFVERQPVLLFAGQLTRSLVLRPTGRIAILGVRLHPAGAAGLFRQPQSEFLGMTVGVDVVSRDLDRSLTEVRDSAAGPVDAVDAIQERLAVLADPARIDSRIGYVVESIQRHRGRVSIERMAARVGFTRRHLERRFKSSVGISPKRLARIARFQHALRVLDENGSHRKGAHTAAMCGYADQSHFVRECRELCGHPPGTHILQRAQLTGFFMD